MAAVLCLWNAITPFRGKHPLSIPQSVHLTFFWFLTLRRSESLYLFHDNHFHWSIASGQQRSHTELNPGTTDTWRWIILCCGGSPVCCRMFSSVPGFYPLDVSCPSAPSHDSQECLQTLSNVPLGVLSSGWELLDSCTQQEKGQTYNICKGFRFMATENRLIYFFMPLWEHPRRSVWMCLKWIFLCFN